MGNNRGQTYKKVEKPLQKDKLNNLLEGVGKWASFYRENPHRFAIDYMGLNWLRPFQQVLINVCLKYPYVMIIASRGMGKSLIGAIVCLIKCILYPETKICVAAGVKSQSTNVLKKMADIIKKSDNLRREVRIAKISFNEGEIDFYNGSNVSVVTAGENARSNRANMVFGDEFVQIKKPVLDKVLRKFKAGQRTPRFLLKEKYKDYPKEPNTELYLSSAYYKNHYGFLKFKAFFKSMIKTENYCVLGFPYQLPVSEGYYPIEQIKDEMSEDDWDEIGWSMEMDSLFFGESQNAFYSFEELDNARKIPYAIYPMPYYHMLNDNTMKYIPKKLGEIRIISVDVATQGGKKSDATCISIVQLLPYGRGQYARNLIFLTTLEGGHTFDQSLKVRRLYYDFECDYVVVDTNGVGIGVYDNLVQEQADDERVTVYPAWSCKNDDSMAKRSKDPAAPKIIYSIKANLAFNSECAVSLRDVIRRGKFKLLINDQTAVETLRSYKSYNNLPIEKQVLFQEPYYQTTALINEMINLSFELVNGQVRITNTKYIRKDRFSSVSYANYVANILERENKATQESYDYQTFIN